QGAHVDRPVDEVVRDARRFAGTWLLYREVLVNEGIMGGFIAEHQSFSKVLVPNVRRDVVPGRLVDIERRARRIEVDVTENAGHADVVRRFDAARIVEVFCEGPLLG